MAGRERGGDWKALPAVACALVLKQTLSKSFCIFIQIPLTTVRFICWAGSTLSCGLLDRDTGSCLAPPWVSLLPVVGSLQGPGPLAQSNAAAGFCCPAAPWPFLFPAGGQADHGLHVSAGCPYSVQPAAERLPAGQAQLSQQMQGKQKVQTVFLMSARKLELSSSEPCPLPGGRC